MRIIFLPVKSCVIILPSRFNLPLRREATAHVRTLPQSAPAHPALTLEPVPTPGFHCHGNGPSPSSFATRPALVTSRGPLAPLHAQGPCRRDLASASSSSRAAAHRLTPGRPLGGDQARLRTPGPIRPHA